MKITEYAINKKTVSYFAALILLGGGIFSYEKLGKLEFPTFTIKTAVVSTSYPGASAIEVEQEVTDRLEKAVQQLSQIDKVRSISRAGLSIIYVDLKREYDSRAIPQIWDELRRKVSDVQGKLPPGAGPSVVNDDFGDVYGVFFALTGEGYSDQELKDTADFLKRELLLVKDVARVEIWGNQQETVELTISRARMAELGISMEAILNTLNLQNQVTNAGRVKVGTDYIRMNPTGTFTSVMDLGELLLQSNKSGNLIYLKDVVSIRRDYQDPPQWMLRYDGMPALGLGIATVDGGNVVEMGRAVRQRINELKTDIPVGMELQTISYQSDLVNASVKDFVINLVEAVAIVIAVLCITMGLTSGMLMGAILLLTIFGTLIGMNLLDIDFQMISLGALILALGMLVDNAIVVTEGILVRVRQGMGRKAAALKTVNQTAWPLLGATLVAVLAFAAIGTSKDDTGEFLMSLFQVMAISLGLSWVLAITLTPLFCVQFLPKSKSDSPKEPYGGRFFMLYRGFLDFCLEHRTLTLMVLCGILFAAFAGFTLIENNLFPNDSRKQFMLNYWLPEGTHIDETSADLQKLEAYLKGLKEVTGTTTFVGRGGLRFVLTYEPEMPNSSYGQILVSVKEQEDIEPLMGTLRRNLPERFPDAKVELKKFRRGPGEGAQIQARFSGPEIRVLRRLANEVEAIMATDPISTDIRNDWRQPVPVLRPQVAEAAARRLGITRPQVADALAMNFSGKTIGLYREQDELMPINIGAPLAERQAVEQIDDMVVFSPVTGKAVPMKQIVTGMETEWEDTIIRRYNRRRTITVGCNPIYGNPSTLLTRIGPEIEAIPLPPGYELEWGGDYESSQDANKGLFQMVPVFFLAMIFTVVALFNAVRQTVIIFMCLPLVSIGVTAGLLVTGHPFGFMCILGYLGLSGMIIKNAVVLIDQIDLEIRAGKNPHKAILDSSVSRLRPVSMASLTTILGMLPLLKDVFFVGMSITIIGGLTFGTVLTLLVVPVLYSVFFRIRSTS
jgi:multidrug efflux pump subunit AcrB